MRDVRVLEIAGGHAGAYCARLFAAVGADVVLVEPPAGGELRRSGPWCAPGISATHEYLNGGKRSVILDESAASESTATGSARDGDLLDDAYRWADLVISSCDGDVDATTARHERIAAVNPACVHVVLSGFGLDGPYARWRHSPLVDWASGGYAYLTGEPDREPLQGGGPWGAYLTGVTGAIGAMAALMDSARTGSGQLVDVGAMEAIAAAHQWTMTMYTHTGAIKGRWGARFGEAYHPMSLFRCQDDNWICIGAPSRDQWENFCITTGLVEMLADDDLYAPGVRFERAQEIDDLLEPWLLSRTAADAVEELQASRVPASLVLTYVDVLRSEHLAERGYWDERKDLVQAGSDDIARMPGPPFLIDGVDSLDPAPVLGADTESFRGELTDPSTSPRHAHPAIDLSQVRVAEFTVAWAGPLAGRFLADLGAQVVKVEHPTSRGFGVSENPTTDGSEGWTWGTLAPPSIRAEIFPDADPGKRSWNRMGIWNKMNRGKHGVCLDAKTEDGKRILDELVGTSDLLLHNFSPRGARSLGIDHDRLVGVNPGIASVAMTGYGETGPMATHFSYGPILEAYGGFDEATGYVDHGPIRVGIAFPDAVGGVHGAFASLVTLWERARRGESVHVDLSQLETLLGFAGEALLVSSITGRAPDRPGNRSTDHAPQGVYACVGDDAWIAVTVADDEGWRQLVALLADDELSSIDGVETASLQRRLELHEVIDAAIGRWTSRHVPGDAARRLQGIGVAACPTFTNADIVDDEHIAARGFMVTWDQPDVGPRRFPGFPIHFGNTEIELRPAPPLGEYNSKLLHDLGYDDEQIARLEQADVIADHPPT